MQYYKDKIKQTIKSDAKKISNQNKTNDKKIE